MSTRYKADPTMHDVLAVINGMAAVKIERDSGVCASTVRSWRSGKTLSPQNKTLEFALRSAGYKRIIVRA